MSVITPDFPITSDSALALEDAPPIPTPNKYTGFKRPIAPDYDQARDNELLNCYFDANWTTKDIAEHFKLSIAVVAAWFQRADIVAIIDFIAAANERRARDITRANLPSTIDILHRISQVRNSDAAARQASCALVRFARGASVSKTTSQRVSKAKPAPGKDAGTQVHPDGSGDHSAFTRARRAGEIPTRGLRDDRDFQHTGRDRVDRHDSDADVDTAIDTNTDSIASPINHPDFHNTNTESIATAIDARETHFTRSRNDRNIAGESSAAALPKLTSTFPHAPRTAADLIARAGTTFTPDAPSHRVDSLASAITRIPARRADQIEPGVNPRFAAHTPGKHAKTKGP